MDNKHEKHRIRLSYLLKQLLPLKYTSRYSDAMGNTYFATWRQWFGHVFNYTVRINES